jgi:outer membrane receptor protein involved in Fe transport
MLLRISFFLLSFLIIGNSFSQNMHISGVINDTLNNKPLHNAAVVISRIKDSVIIDFQRTDIQGRFDFKNIPIDTVELLITHYKFNDQTYYLFGSKDNYEFHIPNIIPLEKTKEIREVVILANKEAIYYRGDTLVYVADSFNVKANAVVEDLIKKLPGLEVDKDGKIKSQGKSVEKVLVDGDEFFGSDPLVATRNLSARSVETVEVYEKENENTSDGSTETIQVMNLKLKDEAKQGYFGRVGAGSDFNKFYEGEVLTSVFNKNLKLSVFGQASNTPNSGFNWSDINQYGLDNERQNIIDEDGNWSFVGSAPRQGLPQTYKAGFYFSDKISDKTKIGVNYTYNDNQVIANTDQTSQFFLTDTTYATNDKSAVLNRVQQHIVNANIEYALDSLTTLTIKPRFVMNSTTQSNETTTDFLTEERTPFSQTKNLTENNSSELEFSNVTKLTRLFKKKYRQLEMTYQFDYKDNNADGKLVSSSILTQDEFILQSFDQRKTGSLSGTGNMARLSYHEPLSKKWRLEFEYQFQQYHTRQTRSSFNGVDGIYNELDSLYSNDFENQQFINYGGAFARFENTKHMIRFGTRVRNTTLDNTNLFIDQSFNQNVNNVLPRVMYNFKMKQNSRISLNYSTDAQMPSINQLQPLLDNNNPNRIVIGNPDLKPTYTNTLRLNYHLYKPLTGFYIWSGGSFTHTNNAFSSAIEFDQFGRTVSQTINVDGNYYGNFYSGTSLPLYKQILKLNLNADANTSSYNNKINGLDNTTINNGIGGGGGLTFDNDSLYFNIDASIDYNVPKSTLNTGANQPYFTQTYTATFEIDLFWNLIFRTQGKYLVQSQRAEGFDIEVFLLDVSIKKNFLKNENLVLALSVNDLFNQNTTASRSIQTNMIIDNRTQIISRYFMVKMTYNFKNKLKTNQDETF